MSDSRSVSKEKKSAESVWRSQSATTTAQLLTTSPHRSRRSNTPSSPFGGSRRSNSPFSKSFYGNDPLSKSIRNLRKPKSKGKSKDTSNSTKRFDQKPRDSSTSSASSKSSGLRRRSKKWENVPSPELSTRTVFENDIAPAKTTVEQRNMQWKSEDVVNKDIETAKERSLKDDEVKKEDEVKPEKKEIAKKTLYVIKRNNLLEDILRSDHTETLRKFFTDDNADLTKPPEKVLELINKAFDIVLNTILFRADELDTPIDAEMTAFFLNKQEARRALVETLLSCTDMLPTKWGGRVVRSTEVVADNPRSQYLM